VAQNATRPREALHTSAARALPALPSPSNLKLSEVRGKNQHL